MYHPVNVSCTETQTLDIVPTVPHTVVMDTTEAVDDYTLRHLDAYVDAVCWEDEAEEFTTWARAQVAADPGLADVGWDILHRAWDRQR
jgi:phage tail protein X